MKITLSQKHYKITWLKVDASLVYLAQTDTTVGFLSQDKTKLNAIKERKLDQPCLICVPTYSSLLTKTRVPNAFKNRVRRAKKTTFLYPNGLAIRVVMDPYHKAFLKQFGWMYSTSANFSGKSFDYSFALEKADKIVEDERGFFEAPASKLWQIRSNRKRRVR